MYFPVTRASDHRVATVHRQEQKANVGQCESTEPVWQKAELNVTSMSLFSGAEVTGKSSLMIGGRA
jgi:hypothetical protein